MNESTQKTLESITKHDVWYHMSDDQNVYKRGRDNEEIIRGDIAKLAYSDRKLILDHLNAEPEKYKQHLLYFTKNLGG